jgi:hypothetical protein
MVSTGCPSREGASRASRRARTNTAKASIFPLPFRLSPWRADEFLALVMLTETTNIKGRY